MTLAENVQSESNKLSPVKHVPGTVYPYGGRPHLGTMCQHRTGIRRNYGHETVLCYNDGEFHLQRADGSLYSIQCADGLVPVGVCAKHLATYLKWFSRGSLTPIESAIAKATGGCPVTLSPNSGATQPELVAALERAVTLVKAARKFITQATATGDPDVVFYDNVRTDSYGFDVDAENFLDRARRIIKKAGTQ